MNVALNPLIINGIFRAVLSDTFKLIFCMCDYILRYQASPEYVRTTRLNKTCSPFSIADLAGSFCSLKLLINILLKLSVEVVTLLVKAYSSNVKVEEEKKTQVKYN